MESNDTRRKLNGILEALASGRSCEQILSEDRTLSYHDIFHAVAEAPTSYWDRSSTGDQGAGSPPTTNSIRPPARRAD